jgi:hypothetical protein
VVVLVYAIQAGKEGPIKFGVARNPLSRLSTLQTGNHEPLRLVVAVNLKDCRERQIHYWLREERLRGEWFSGPKTTNVLSDLKTRARCVNHDDPGDEYGFWLAVDGCGGSCAPMP